MTVSDLRSVYEAEQETVTTATDARNNYESAIDTAEADATSTLQIYLGGAAVLGSLLGAIGGIAVPLRAARSVEESIVLDSSVEYDRKAVIVPVLIGLVLVVIGGSIVAVFGGQQLLEVIV